MIVMAATALSARSFISVRSMGSYARQSCPSSKRPLPQRQIGLIAFNDRFCRSAAELCSVILKPRATALENAKNERRPRHSKIGFSPNWNAVRFYAGPPATRPRNCLCLRSLSQPKPIRSR